MINKTIIYIMALATEGLSVVDIVSADPKGPGQPCAQGATCNTSNPLTSLTPGGLARGSPFNPDGVDGTVYAGNPGTASLLHANNIFSKDQAGN